MRFTATCSEWLCVKGRFVLYGSRARTRLLLPYRNYSVEAFYKDACECVGVKTLEKHV